ncbi:MAG TPA: GDSL-type esterase/lipase family protein [Methylomirabilota bacterium]|nr:GDSL-type esterase/lipase family protein [Methylomirabilota bacterium]
MVGRSLVQRGAAVAAAALLVAWAPAPEAAGFWLPADIGSNDPQVVLAIGDSITVGVLGDGACDTGHCHVADRPYPTVLLSLLTPRHPGLRMLNHGRGGETTGDGVGRLRDLLIQNRPLFVLIMEGTNDANVGRDPGEIVGHLREMVRLVKANSSIPILAAIVPNFTDPDAQSITEAVNARLPEMAQEEGVRFVNTFAAMNDQSLFGPQDLLHPNQRGYEVLGAAWAQAVSDAIVASRALLGGVSVAGGRLSGDPTSFQVIAGSGAGGSARVRTFRTDNRPFGPTFMPYPAAFLGGVRVAACDFDRDGRDEIVMGAAPGGGPQVLVFKLGADGRPISVLASFFPFPLTFTGGVAVACGDLDRDGIPEIVVAAGRGAAPQVRAFRYVPRAPGGVVALPVNFAPFPLSFQGGATVAVADLDGDRRAEIIVGAGPGGLPQVRVFRYAPGAVGGVVDYGLSFLAYVPQFTGGVFVAAGDLDGDGRAELVTGAGRGGLPRVRVFGRASSGRVTERASFLAYPQTFPGGVFVGIAGQQILTGAGPGGWAQVRGFTMTGAPTGTSFIAY